MWGRILPWCGSARRILSDVLTDWPFVGCAQELSELERLLTEGQCNGLVLAGVAGVGKTFEFQRCAWRAQLSMRDPAGQAGGDG
jgi:hypothetical protein